jgi:hypothetical protein
VTAYQLGLRLNIKLTDHQLANLCFFKGWPFTSRLRYPSEVFEFPEKTLEKAMVYLRHERRAHRRK